MFGPNGAPLRRNSVPATRKLLRHPSDLSMTASYFAVCTRKPSGPGVIVTFGGAFGSCEFGVGCVPGLPSFGDGGLGVFGSTGAGTFGAGTTGGFWTMGSSAGFLPDGHTAYTTSAVSR